MSCDIFSDPRRPLVCAEFKANSENCGADRDEALAILTALELATRPFEKQGYDDLAGCFSAKVLKPFPDHQGMNEEISKGLTELNRKKNQ
jgi:hypothetical protein